MSYNGKEISPSEWDAADRQAMEMDDEDYGYDHDHSFFTEVNEMPEPKIKEVYFERVFNIAPYESFKIGFTATVGPTDTVHDLLVALDKHTVRARNEYLTPVKAGK